MTNQFTTREYVIRLILTIFVVSITLAIWELRSALMLTFLSAIIAVGLAKPVAELQKRGLSRGIAMSVTLLGTFTVITLMMILIVPRFFDQVSSLIDQLPSALNDAEMYYNDIAHDQVFLPELGSTETLSDDNITDFLVTQAGSASRTVFPFLTDIGGLITNIVVMITITIFILSEPNIYVEGMLTLVPRNYRPRALEIMNELAVAVRVSLGAQLVSMFFIGVLTTLGLVIIGLENAFALGVIAGLLAFIPTFGATISLIFGLIFTLATGPEKIVFVIILYIAIQQAEANVITPRVVKRALNLPSALVIITQISAGILFGFLGLILAVPLVAVILVLVRELYVYDALNSQKAEITVVDDEQGRQMVLVSNEQYRPEDLSPGQHASLVASGRDPYEYAGQHRIEIINPAEKQMNDVARGQQAVWVAILALVAAQAMGFIRAIIDSDNSNK